jgi:hypothetical protein
MPTAPLNSGVRLKMISEETARQLLIDSCHSSSDSKQRILSELNSPEFVALLGRIAVDAQDRQGDAPMQAAYFLTVASPALIRPHETELLGILTTADGYSGSVAFGR